MTITVDAFSILSFGLLSTTESTSIVGAPPASTGRNFAKLLNRLATITHITDEVTFDDYGRPETASTTTTENVKCRVQEENNFYIQDGKTLNVKTYIGFFLPNCTVAVRDVVTVESVDYKVTDVDPVYKRRAKHHLEVSLDRMEI